MAASSGSDGGHYDDEFGDYASRRKKPCRTCTDFKTWAKSKGSTLTKIPDEGRGCPLDRESLGRCSWSFLHTLAAHYPKRPTAEQRTDVEAFFRLFAKFYPCRDCADDFRNSVETRKKVAEGSILNSPSGARETSNGRWYNRWPEEVDLE
ncbi:hypothetical protein HPB47_010689 [Ixodes persulcatus]|uniref:Uncharacterized protein n=1 Tax=Ixodes persulcatus TaxID=34615 RepID=A0AC60NYE4_IXOPE|nr:hypothetical protein HPB47_010689 [Ixodes persulcatus]